MAAAEMVGRLLERYALSMEEIDVREERCVQVEVPIGGKQRRPIDGCVTAIARFCDCKVWVSRDTVMPSYVFFGFDADTALASYLFNVIDRAMATALTAFRAAHPRLRALVFAVRRKVFSRAWRHASPIGSMRCIGNVTPMSPHSARPVPLSSWSNTRLSRMRSERPRSGSLRLGG